MLENKKKTLLNEEKTPLNEKKTLVTNKNTLENKKKTELNKKNPNLEENTDITQEKAKEIVDYAIEAAQKYDLTSIHTKTKINIHNLNYFFKLKKDNRYLIQGILYPKTIVMLYSPPTQFKSIISQQIGFSVARGKPFMGLKTKKQPVLICDMENNEQTLKTRLMALFKGNKYRQKKMPLYYIVRQGNLDDDLFVYKLKETIQQHEIKLVMFDTLHRFSQYEENKADDINRLYTTVFQPIADECDCTVLFLHHTTKDGQYRGSGDFLGMVDAAFSVKRKKKTNQFRIICEKARWGEIDEIHGEIDFGEDYIQINKIDVDLERMETQRSITIQKECTSHILVLFPVIGHTMKRTEIIEEIEKTGVKFAKRTYERCLSFLIREKVLDKKKKGYYNRICDAETYNRIEKVAHYRDEQENQNTE